MAWIVGFGQGGVDDGAADGQIGIDAVVVGDDEVEAEFGGETKKTLQFTVARDSTTRKCVAFGQARLLKKLSTCQTVSLAYRPILNDFNGRRSAELQVEDMHFN